MDEPRDELRDTLAGAVPPLPLGLQARAVAAMAATAPSARNGRSRLVPIAVGVVALLLTLGLDTFGPLRHPPLPQGPAMGEASAAAVEAPPPANEGEEQSPEEKAVAPYRDRAAAFVRARYPKDAEMLMAAGLLTTDPKTSLALLKQSLSIKGSTGAWAAYVIRLVEEGPQYHRPGESGIDPADPRQVAEEARMAPEMHLPDRLSEQEAAPILATIRDWERAEPQNCVPVMYEAWYLYGLHRDTEALARWRQAGRLPRFSVGYWDQTVAVARLLSRMGMSGYRAILASYVGGDSYKRFAFARTCARFATYEGRLAQLQGRPRDAVAWWDATMQLGRHAEDSADTIIQVLVGGAVEGIGAGYVWRWHMVDDVNGKPVGPLMGGRLYQGQAYAFYVSQAGQKAADEVRDSLLKAKVRSMVLHEHSALWQALPRWMWVLGNAAFAGVLTAALLAAFAAFGAWRRREADEATRLGWGLRLLIVILALLPGLAAGMLASWLAELPEPTQLFDPARAVPAALLLALFLAVALPFVAVWTSRRPGARVTAAWRGNLRQTLPLAVAICGALALCFGISGKIMQTAWMRQWYSGRPPEMTRVLHAIGSEWEHPRIPADAWRAEPIPEAGQK